jgi:hypothetical protein
LDCLGAEVELLLLPLLLLLVLPLLLLLVVVLLLLVLIMLVPTLHVTTQKLDLVPPVLVAV